MYCEVDTLMARARYRGVALTHPLGQLPVNIIPNAEITLYEGGTTTPFSGTIYEEKVGGGTLSNPFFADSDGNFLFYLDSPNDLNIKVVGTGTGPEGITLEYEPVESGQNEPILFPDGTELLPGAAFQNDQSSGIRLVSNEYMAIVVGGKDVIRMKDDVLGPRIGIGNVDEPGVTDNPENLFYSHYSSNQNSNGVIGIMSSVTENAAAVRAAPSVVPDASGGTFVIAQTDPLATGAGRALESHAIRALVSGAGHLSWMGQESGIHTGQTGNSNFPATQVNPGSIGIWLSSSRDANMVFLGIDAVPADVGLFINPGFDGSAGGRGGFRYPIYIQDFDYNSAFHITDIGNTFTRGYFRAQADGSTNAAQVTYGFSNSTLNSNDGPGNKGMFDAGMDNVGFSTNGIEVIRLTQNQAVGIGIDTVPSGYKLKVVGNTLLQGNLALNGVIQDSDTDQATVVALIPNGTNTVSAVQTYNNSNTTNAALLNLSISDTVVGISSSVTGSGTYLPLVFYSRNAEVMRTDLGSNNSNVPGIIIGGTSALAAGVKFQVVGGLSELVGIRNTGPWIVNNAITPTPFSAQQDNYAPTGIDTCNIINLEATGATQNISGFQLSSYTGQTGRFILLQNVGGQSINFLHETTSTAANRINTHTGVTFTLTPGRSIWMFYTTNGRWRLQGE